MRGGWKISTLGELCKFENGDRGKNYPGRKAFVPSGIPFINAGHLDDGKIDWQGMDFIPQNRYDLLGNGKVQKFDLLFCLRGSLGKFGVVDRDIEGAIASSLVIVRPSEQLECDFLAAYFRSALCAEMISKYANGAAQPNLSAKSLKEFQIPFPPIPEQKRIVAILDEAFAGIDTAIANTEKNLANARELFESYLNSIFTKRGKGWVDIKLDEACVVERGSSPRPIKSYLTDSDDGVNWVKIGDTKGITKYIQTTKQKIIQEGALRSRRVDPGDFILTNSMSFGRPYIMATTGYIHDGWFVLRLKKHIDTEYFYYLLSSRMIQEQFGLLAAGAVVKNISSDLVKQAILPVPPIEQQVLIVKTVELLSEQVQALEGIYKQKANSLKELKQSLLQKAFSGELTTKSEKLIEEAVA